MNKLTKAGIATGAAVALLMGGAGTLAYWNSEANLATGSINAGNLTVTSPGAGVWTDADGDTITNIGTYRIVPGDTLTFSKNVSVYVEGDTLEAELELAADAITAASANADDVALAALLTDTADFSIAATGASVSPAGDVVTFDGDHNSGVTYTVALEVVIAFPNGSPTTAGLDGLPSTLDDVAVADNTAKTGSVSLANFDVVLKQVFLP